MLIYISTSIAAAAQDLILVQNFHLQMEGWKKMSLIFQGKYILILGEGPLQRLDDTMLTAEAIYPINFTQQEQKKICIKSTL